MSTISSVGGISGKGLLHLCQLRMFLQKLPDRLRTMLNQISILLAKSGEKMTVDIQLADNPVPNEHRGHDL